jgi:hypothetical protein
MPKIISILAMLFVLASPAMAQTTPTTETAPAAAEEEERGLGFWVETRTVKSGPSEVVVYFDKYLTGSVGFYAQVVKDSAGYASAYVGPKFKIAEGIEVGIGIGRERAPGYSSPVRNAWIFIDQEQYSLYATVEKGDAGKWHKAIALYKLSDAVNVGVMNESFLGTGPRVEYKVAKDFQVWGAVLRSYRKTTPVLAANFSF